MRSPFKTLRRFVPLSLTACGLLLVLFGLASCALRQAGSPPANSPITLHASNATVHATMMRYEPQTNKNCLGYWTKAEDWADWTFDVARAGSFEVDGEMRGHGRSEGVKDGQTCRVKVAASVTWTTNHPAQTPSWGR